MDNTLSALMAPVWKTIIAIFLLVLVNGLAIARTTEGKYIGISLLIFIVLPTFFVVFLKKWVCKKCPNFAKKWKFFRIVYVAIIVLFILLIVIGAVSCYQKYGTLKPTTVTVLQSTKSI